MERLNLRVPDVVGELLQARKNMGKARCPAGGLAGRHGAGVVVGARDGPKACSWWDEGAVWAEWARWQGGRVAGGWITQSLGVRLPWRGRNWERGSGWQERGAVDSLVVERAAVLAVWRARLQRVLTDGPSATPHGRGPQQQPCAWPRSLVRCLGGWRTS